jgi:hypothetical protein
MNCETGDTMMLPPTTVEMFECLLEDIAERLAACPPVENVTQGNVALLLVTTSWLETSTRYGEAIRTLLAEDCSGGVGPLERALWEMWINWKFLLNHSSDRDRSAAKVLLLARIEGIEFSKKHAGDVRKTTLDSLQTELDGLVRLYPEAYDEVMAQRNGRPRRWTWSGISYTQMEQDVTIEPVLYKLLSWDTHGTVGTYRDVRVKREGQEVFVTFGRRDDDPMANPARVAYLATEVLYDMFEDWRELWKLPALHATRE